jgi:hypothetical protein
MRVLPVAETSGTFGSSSSALPTVSVRADHEADQRRPFLAEHLGGDLRHRDRVSGVFSDGFHRQLSPQTSASIEFHAHTAIGKLKAVMTPTCRAGATVSRMWCCGRSLCDRQRP